MPRFFTQSLGFREMSIDTHDVAAVEKKFWREVEQSRFAMLTVEGMQNRHFQPMTTFVEPETSKIWFYTRRDSEIAERSVGGASATLVVVSKDQELQASVIGRLTASSDELHRDKYWNPVVAAWFPGGKDDPNLAMLCLDCEEAEIWISDRGGLRFGWEIVRANLTGSEPELGGHVVLPLK